MDTTTQRPNCPAQPPPQERGLETAETRFRQGGGESILPFVPFGGVKSLCGKPSKQTSSSFSFSKTLEKSRTRTRTRTNRHAGFSAQALNAALRSARAFTLIELLVVIVIIGILTGLVMPSIKNLGTPNVMAAAARQLVDDLALARQRAITERANVYVVFFSRFNDYVNSSGLPLAAYAEFFGTNQQANQLLGAQYATYAIYTRRGVGDQPGVNFPRYLTEWKHLPEGAFIPPVEFANTNIFNNALNNALGDATSMIVPFPTTNLQRNLNLPLPWIGFDPQGKLLTGIPYPNNNSQLPTLADPVTLKTRKTDLRIRIALGASLENKNPDGTFPVGDNIPLEMPAYNWPVNALPGEIDPATRIAINWLTGRARVERAQIP